MIVIGLGSNVGDRLDHLRQAIAQFNQHDRVSVRAISPVYASDAQLPDKAPPTWNLPFLNAAILCESSLTPHQLLAVCQQVESQLGRIKQGRWSPRLIDCDILYWAGVSLVSDTLTVPHPALMSRPFMLWPLMDIFTAWDYPHALLCEWGSRFSKEAPCRTYQIPQRIDGSRLMGVVNMTPDSFSDGGLFCDTQRAVEHAQALFESGAEVIDLGAESTRPGSQAVSPVEEWRRIEPVLMALNIFWKGQVWRPKLSVDTRHADTAAKAIDAGVDWINDVTGFSDPAMIEAVKTSDVKLVSMHSLSIPPSQQQVLPIQQDSVQQVLQWGFQQLAHFQQVGIDPARVILDPGVGFGKTPYQNLALMQRANELRQWQVPILIGHSRKSFHQLASGVSAAERDLETALGTIELFKQGIDYVRVHDVTFNWRAIQMAQCYRSQQVPEMNQTRVIDPAAE